METITNNLENTNNKKTDIRSQWRSASQRYYEKNKELLRAKKLAHYHKKKSLSESPTTLENKNE